MLAHPVPTLRAPCSLHTSTSGRPLILVTFLSALHDLHNGPHGFSCHCPCIRGLFRTQTTHCSLVPPSPQPLPLIEQELRNLSTYLEPPQQHWVCPCMITTNEANSTRDYCSANIEEAARGPRLLRDIHHPASLPKKGLRTKS